MSEKIALANAYLFHVLAAENNFHVKTVYGYEWPAFKPLLEMVEGTAKLEDVALFRKRICEQFYQGRMDFLYETLDKTFESLLQEKPHQVNEYLTLFPSPPPFEGVRP